MTTSKWTINNHPGGIDQAHSDESIQKGLAEGTIITTEDGSLQHSFDSRVQSGMEILDKVAPGWQEELNLPVLDLEDDQMCVLGQAWPHYAKMRGLADITGDYKQFADAVLSVGGNADREELASSIGCALANSDLALVDQLALAEWKRRHGDERVPTIHCPREKVQEWDDILRESIAKVWEQLTKTWVTEITKAREEGRWDSSSAGVGSAEQHQIQTTQTTTPLVKT